MGSTGGPGASETRRYFLTIIEVMAIFRVGRLTAYALAREYIESGGNGGIPCEKVGGLLRFPTAEIERLIRRPVAFPVSDTATGRSRFERAAPWSAEPPNLRPAPHAALSAPTFSAPKSLSVWWALTGDHRLLDAAVTATLGYLERFGSTTRVRANGGRLHPESQGLSMAAFRQSTSRADDPQIHTDAVISAKCKPSTDAGWHWTASS